MLDKKSLLIAGLGGVAILGGAGMIWQSQAQNMGMHPMMNQAQPMGMMQHMGHMTVNSELDYIAEMIPHHQEAVDSAQLLLSRSQRPEMKEFAQAIITAQTAEIIELQAWLQEWYPDAKPQVAYKPMMRDLTQLTGDALDQAFLEDMVMHHRGAVMMSQQLIQKNLVKHPPVGVFAQDVITAQNNEISQMQAWLSDWFGIAQNQSMQHHQHH